MPLTSWPWSLLILPLCLISGWRCGEGTKITACSTEENGQWVDKRSQPSQQPTLPTAMQLSISNGATSPLIPCQRHNPFFPATPVHWNMNLSHSPLLFCTKRKRMPAAATVTTTHARNLWGCWLIVPGWTSVPFIMVSLFRDISNSISCCATKGENSHSFYCPDS